MQGPHNVALRGNAPFMRLGRVMADLTAYLIVFVTLTGVYLGRRGLALGVVSCGALIVGVRWLIQTRSRGSSAQLAGLRGRTRTAPSTACLPLPQGR